LKSERNRRLVRRVQTRREQERDEARRVHMQVGRKKKNWLNPITMMTRWIYTSFQLLEVVIEVIGFDPHLQRD